MRTPRIPWTPEEDEYLRQNYKKRTKEEAQAIAEHLGRTVVAVRERARLLGLYQRWKQPRWKPEDDEFLRQNWLIMSDKQLAKKLGRGVGSIEDRRFKLGLHRSKLPPVDFSINQAAEALGVDDHVVLRWINLGWLRAKKRGRSAATTIKPGDLREFLQNNPDKWDSRKARNIIAEINKRELERDMRRWRTEAGHIKRTIPKHLRPAFARFVADVAMAAHEKIQESRNPSWYREKVEQDRQKSERHAQRWTREEDRMLRLMYVQGLSYTEMAKRLDRSYAAVAHRMGRTNIWAV